MSFSTIVSEGNLIPADLLAQIAEGKADGQQPADFGFEKARRLTDEIAAAWADAKAYWEALQRSLRRLRDDDSATTVTRERWIVPLLETLGYKLTYQPTAAVASERAYPISHRAGDADGPPIHIEGLRRSLDLRGSTGRSRVSPHALVQEYLNATEQLWGIVTNGERLRLLRDSSRTVRPVYVEFDLRAMLEGEKFSEFALLYRLLHRTRLPQTADDASRCLLERYHQQAIEAGGRVRDGLRDGVDLALRALGAGLLQHLGSAQLREKVASNELSALDYYRQLLRLVYRLLFLMVAEERSLIGGTEAALRVYRDYYSVSRLRRLAEGSASSTIARHSDLWLGLLATFRLLEDDEAAQALGVAALDGDLFGPQAMPDLAGAKLDNLTLLRAVRALSLYRDPQSKALRRVNYAALDVEELGSVYESLLDYRPVVRAEGSGLRADVAGALSPQPSALGFDLVSGTERKTTGSYYTRPELVHELIKSALEPVLAERIKEAESDPRWRRRSADDLPEPDRALPPETQAKVRAILALRVVDPAAGSGHFLLAAARRLGRELACVRSGEDQPAPTEFRRAVREVIARCIYAVDLNPLAVDLCKVALWLESLEPGKPLSFLDSKVRWGNSLVGATRELVAKGIPDEAYKPVTGDDKAAASMFRKRNKREREARQSGQLSLGLEFEAPAAAGARYVSSARALNAMPDDSVVAVREKARQYEELRAVAYSDIVRFNLWTAAFFTLLRDAGDVAVPTTAALDEWDEKPLLYTLMVKGAFELAEEVGFFHWELEFPDIFPEGEPGGFDVVLGNPPWEMLEFVPEEFFAGPAPEIASAPNKTARDRLIEKLPMVNPSLFELLQERVHKLDAERRFFVASNRYPLTSYGRINAYALFAELFIDVLSVKGWAGIITPIGILADSFNQKYFGRLMKDGILERVIGFENESLIFSGVHHAFKFCAVIISKGRSKETGSDFIFYCRNFEQVGQTIRHFKLTDHDIVYLSPNTLTCPIFRTSVDAELNKKTYQNIPVLVNEASDTSPWEFSALLMFMMAGASHLFSNSAGSGNLPLYEAKLLHQFNHRWATYEGAEARDFELFELENPVANICSRYWVSAQDVKERLQGRWSRNWLIAWRDIARSTDERTSIFCVLPLTAVGHTAPVATLNESLSSLLHSCFVFIVNSMIFDYFVRQKVSGTHLTFGLIHQLPVIPPDRFTPEDIAFIVPRVVELVYTAWDIRAFAEDVWAEGGEALRVELLRRNAECNAGADPALFAPRDGFPLPPYRWDEGRRAHIRAELDARIARLYGLTRDELRYILDPADVYGPEFPGETFRVLKEKETRLYGEYRTRRLVLEAWDREEGAHA